MRLVRRLAAFHLGCEVLHGFGVGTSYGQSEVVRMMGVPTAEFLPTGSASSFTYSLGRLLIPDSRVITVLWKVENIKENANIGVIVGGKKERTKGYSCIQNFCIFYIQVSVS